MSRTRLLVSALTLSAVLAVTGCAPSGGDTEATITWAIEGANLSSGHMDPHASQLDVSAYVMRNVLDSLVAQTPDGEFEPWLAESWVISEDGLHYTFTLREDVTFSNGEKLDAAAVKANFDHITAEETASAQAASMLGGEFYAGTEVLGDYEVEVNFTQPYAPFLSAAATAFLGIYAPSVLTESEDVLKAGGPDVSIGSGPFLLTELVADQQLTFSRNDDYQWGPDEEGPAGFDKLVISIIPESSVRAAALGTLEADVASKLAPNSVSELASTVTVNAVQTPGVPYSTYLNQVNGVFADPLVRQAFRLGFDLDAAVDTIFFGQYARAWSALSPSTPNSYDPSVEGTWAFDPEAAGALLDQAGWTERDGDGFRTKDGERLSARWIAYTPVSDENAQLAASIQADLADIGFEIVHDVLEPGAYMDSYTPGTFDLTDWGFASVDADVLRAHLGTDGYQNAAHVSDPDVDELLAQGVATSDLDERQGIYSELQQWNNDNVAIVPLYVPAFITASNEQILHLTFDAYGWPLFQTATTTIVEG